MHRVHKNDLPVLVYSTAIAGEESKVIIYFFIVTAVVTSLHLSSPLRTLSLTLSWDTKARSGTSFTVWYSTDGHERDPTSPPQGALMVSVLNSTSVTITLPDSDDSCKPYYVWIAGITPNGQQTPYSKRWRVEVCKASGGESKNMYIPYQKAYFSTCKNAHCTYSSRVLFEYKSVFNLCLML